MKTISKVAAVFAVGLSLGAASSAYSSAIEGTVRDANGHVLPGAEIRVESKNGSLVKQVQTNTKGRYAESDLASGTYHVSLIVNGQTKAMITNVAPRADETEILNFSLARSGRAEPSAAGKHYVLLKSPTGTHLDHWVEVTQMPGDMSIGMQERSRSSASTVVRAYQQNSGAVHY